LIDRPASSSTSHAPGGLTLKWWLAFEPCTALEEGFDWEHTEGIADVRVASEWPLPGESMIVHEGEKPSKVIIFYDNHFNLDSAQE
jgi:hypothetical protein